VLEEQARNFISRAHRGQTSIIPWPVIESRQFYELFNQLRKMLAKSDVLALEEKYDQSYIIFAGKKSVIPLPMDSS